MNYLFKMGLSALKYRLLKIRTPVNLMLSVTDRCNGKCQYCGIPGRGKKELSREQIFQIIDEFVRSGGSRIALWGGEPLMRKDIGEIISHCRGKGLLTSMDTNGYLVPDRINEIKELDVLVISFDGDENLHDMNREKGSFKKVIKAFESACGKMLVWTITVLTKHNLESIDYILERAKEYGFYTTWQVLHHRGLGSGQAQAMLPEPEEYRDAIKNLMQRKEQGAPIVNSMKYFQYLLDWKDYAVPISKERKHGLSCYAGQLYCNIDTDGVLYPCSVLIDDVPGKNVLEQGFKEAFDYAKNIPCQSCSAGCYIEYNYIYSLNLGVICNWFKFIRKRKSKKPGIILSE